MWPKPFLTKAGMEEGPRLMPRDPSNSPGARALRLAGYVKLPAWWVTEEQLELMAYMAKQNLPEINKIKERVENQNGW
jgi:hypothetical protein